jgi:hypothetical protein
MEIPSSEAALQNDPNKATVNDIYSIIMSLCESIQPDFLIIQDAAVGFSRPLSTVYCDNDIQKLQDYAVASNTALGEKLKQLKSLEPIGSKSKKQSNKFKEFRTNVANWNRDDLENFLKGSKVPSPLPSIRVNHIQLWKVDSVKNTASFYLQT